MKTFKLILLLSLPLFIFAGCAQKEIVVQDRVTKVKVPTKPKRPKVECDFRADTNLGVIGKMVECIGEYKRVLESVTVP